VRSTRDILDDESLEEQPVTDATLREVEKSFGVFRGSVRLATGRIYTDEQFEERRLRVLALPLP